MQSNAMPMKYGRNGSSLVSVEIHAPPTPTLTSTRGPRQQADAANAADRPIVLQALFRPVQDGMVRDDGPPGITPAALLSSIAGAKGGNS